MKNLLVVVVMTCGLFLLFLTPSAPVLAQSTPIQCGSIITGEFTKIGDSKSYTITMGIGEQLVIVGQPERETNKISMLLVGPQDVKLEGSNFNTSPIFRTGGFSIYPVQSPAIRSGRLSVYGTYTIIVSNNRIDAGTRGGVNIMNYDSTSHNGGTGKFVLQVSCFSADGTERQSDTPAPAAPTEVTLTAPIIAARSLVSLECGSIYPSEFTHADETHSYLLQVISTDEQFGVGIEPVGDYLQTIINVVDPRDKEVANTSNVARSPSLSVDVVEEGNYQINVTNSSYSDYAGVGAYSIFITCVTAEGVIQPIEALKSATTASDAIAPVFTGFGFPGAASRDFSAGIEILLALGQMQTVPVASDVALYTYTAAAGETATLSLARVSGDISIGVAVINKDTNEIIFLGGMPSSNNLSVELTFPTDGTYAIGLFRLDTAEYSGTSGAVQIKLE